MQRLISIGGMQISIKSGKYAPKVGVSANIELF